jgi:hypothetical protein
VSGLDFHDCDSKTKVPKTSRSETPEAVTLHSSVEYRCSVCGGLQFIDDHAPTVIPKVVKK